MVSEDREKIRAEELQCKEMAANAQKDLDEALPALEEALKVRTCSGGFQKELSTRFFCVLHVGSGISEQEGHDGDQVLRPSSSSGGDGDAGRDDPAGPGPVLGGGQEAAG